MMNVSEYANDVGKKVSEILKLCQTLDIKVSNEEDMLSDDDIIMLDNMSPLQVAEMVKLINGRAITECSGNITLNTIRDYALSGVDFISSGELTHSVKAFDISLKNFIQL